MTATPKIVTIGVHGLTKPISFAALQKAHVDTLCDVRKRRDVAALNIPLPTACVFRLGWQSLAFATSIVSIWRPVMPVVKHNTMPTKRESPPANARNSAQPLSKPISVSGVPSLTRKVCWMKYPKTPKSLLSFVSKGCRLPATVHCWHKN